MSVNRLSLSSPESWSAPQAPVAEFVGAFMVFPLPLQQGGGVPAFWQEVYQAALEQARAVVRPSRWERCSIPSPN